MLSVSLLWQPAAVVCLHKHTTMKKFYAFLFATAFILNSFQLTAQGIYQYWGTTRAGGNDGQGTLFTTKMDGTGHVVRSGPQVLTPGLIPEYAKPVVYNNKIYTVVSNGGVNYRGIIIEYNPASLSYRKVADMFDIGGNAPEGNLVVYNNKMYGISTYGGSNNKGLLFEFDPATSALVKKYDFTLASLYEPRGELALVGNTLYGTTDGGGATGEGGLYSYNLATSSFTPKKDFGGTLGKGSNGLLAYNSKLYGVNREGGPGTKGVLFDYDPATNTATVRNAFSGGTGAAFPDCNLTLYSSKLYGITTAGGATNAGTIYEFNPANNQYTLKQSLITSMGEVPGAALAVANDKMYACMYMGGTQNKGTVIEYNPATNVVAKKVNCYDAIGINGTCAMVEYNNKLFTLMSRGGETGRGTFIEYDPVANGILVRISFFQNTGLEPGGASTYYNGKIYGILMQGCDNNFGGIYEKDLATGAYTVVHHFSLATGTPGFNDGMTLLNGKLYGTVGGGAAGKGIIYRFDPANNSYTILREFATDNEGIYPSGKLAVYGNTLLGTCAGGGSQGYGAIFQFDPVSLAYSLKVSMSEAWGRYPGNGLMEYNGYYYGLSSRGGTNDRGTLFEYRPQINGFLKKYDFTTQANGLDPEGRLVAAGNKLYGLAGGGASDDGVIFEYVPATGVYTKKTDLDAATGSTPAGGMVYNEATGKLYGCNGQGGIAFSGNLFEYDPAANTYATRTAFNQVNGAGPQSVVLEKAPAITAPGNPGNCASGGNVLIDATNNNRWVPFTNAYGDAIAEINANGQNLGNVTVNYYVHNGAVRKSNSNYYLDRNITIAAQNNFNLPVSVRLYIKKTEFEAIKNTPNAGVANIGNLTIYKNDDVCSNALLTAASPVVTNVSAWGGDYVFSTSVTSFSTFYFATTNAVLPVNITAFSGSKEPVANKLSWQAGCSNDVDFTIERSTDGIAYQAIGVVKAKQVDCNYTFNWYDQQPAAKSWYRLKMAEPNGMVKYSNVILLARDGSSGLQVHIFPNPIAGSQAGIQINSPKQTILQIKLVDALGRVVLQKQVPVQAGANTMHLPMATVGNGMYQLHYQDGEKTGTVRLIKQ